MSQMPRHKARRILLVSPRFQLRAAMPFCALVLLGGALLAFQLFRDAQALLAEAAARGHFANGLTPFGILAGVVVRDLLVAAGALFVAMSVLFAILLRRIRAGISRLAGTLVESAAGDLSAPARAPGPPEIGRFGERLDGIRGKTLALVDELRAEAAALGSGSLSDAEFRERWDALKEKLGRLAP